MENCLPINKILELLPTLNKEEIKLLKRTLKLIHKQEDETTEEPEPRYDPDEDAYDPETGIFPKGVVQYTIKAEERKEPFYIIAIEKNELANYACHKDLNWNPDLDLEVIVTYTGTVMVRSIGYIKETKMTHSKMIMYRRAQNMYIFKQPLPRTDKFALGHFTFVTIEDDSVTTQRVHMERKKINSFMRKLVPPECKKSQGDQEYERLETIETISTIRGSP